MLSMSELIEIDVDSEEEADERMLAICGEVKVSRAQVNVLYEVNVSRELVTVLPEDVQAISNTNMEIVCVDDDYNEHGVDCDMEYLKFLAICNGNGNPYLLEDSIRDTNSPLRIMYNVDDDEESDKKKVEVVKHKKSKVGRKADHKTKETKQKKGQKGKKIVLTKNTTEPKKRGRPRKFPVAEKISKKEKKKMEKKLKKKMKEKKKHEERKAKFQAIIRAPKRLKTENGRVDRNSIPVVNTKRKKVEATRGRKMHMTNLEPKSTTTSHVEAREKENEESISFLDKSYAYYLGYLKKSITIFDAEQQVKAVKDIVVLSDPDIVAVSDRPFVDGGKSLFETNKAGKVIVCVPFTLSHFCF